MRLRLPYPVLSVLILALFACARELPPTNYYVLGLPINLLPQQPAPLPYSLVITPFSAQSPLLRRSVVWRFEHRVGFYTYEKWAELPSRLFTYRLYRRASESNLFRSVRTGVIADDADFVLQGVLTAFEETTTAQGRFGEVALQAALHDAEGKQVWSGTIERREPAQGEGTEAAIHAISQAAENVITELLNTVAQALKQYDGSAAQ